MKVFNLKIYIFCKIFFLLFIISCSNENSQKTKENILTTKDSSIIKKEINDSIWIELQFEKKGSISTIKIHNSKSKISYFYGFHDDGITPCLLCTEKNGNFDGKYYTYYSDGVLNNRVNYKDGKLDGFFENFLENGKLRYRSFYVDGVEQNVEYNDTTNMTDIKIEYITK